LQALIDRKKVVVTEDTIRQDLQLDDADGVECLPNEEIFDELAQPISSPPQAPPAPPLSPPQEQPTQPTHTSESSMTLLNTLMKTCATLTQKVSYLEQDKVTKALEITKLKQRVKKLERKRRSNHSSLKRKPISVAQARKNMIVYLKNMDGYKMQYFKGMTYDQKRAAKETLLQESFKKLRAKVKVSGSHSTQQDTPTVDPKEMSEKDVQNMLQIIPVAEFKVEALQVKYPFIDWEIYFEGSRSYWKFFRVGGITKAYQSFKYMLKDFNREDLDALWRLVKEKFSTALPTVDKEKPFLVELKRLFKPDADDVIWRLQRYMHYLII
nr:hypothetical protein [Tanacetum cinerariifolium]